jgi:hypothetical protein
MGIEDEKNSYLPSSKEVLRAKTMTQDLMSDEEKKEKLLTRKEFEDKLKPEEMESRKEHKIIKEITPDLKIKITFYPYYKTGTDAKGKELDLREHNHQMNYISSVEIIDNEGQLVQTLIDAKRVEV